MMGSAAEAVSYHSAAWRDLHDAYMERFGTACAIK